MSEIPMNLAEKFTLAVLALVWLLTFVDSRKARR